MGSAHGHVGDGVVSGVHVNEQMNDDVHTSRSVHGGGNDTDHGGAVGGGVSDRPKWQWNFQFGSPRKVP